MKKSTVVLAILSVATIPALAQSTVTIYGKFDLGLVVDSGAAAGKSVRLSSGVTGGSRLGFKGTEDLGDGYQAGFTLETGFCADSAAGAPNFCTGGNFMGRQAHGDLSGRFGNIAAGRQYSLSYNNDTQIDPFGAGFAGDFANVIDNSGPRNNNMVKYQTPVLAGLQAGAEISFGEQTGNWAAGREVGGLVSYSNGPAYVGVAIYSMDNANGQGRAKRDIAIGGTYDLGVVKLHGMYQRTDGAPTGEKSLDSDNWLVGLTVPVAGGRIMASYILKNDTTLQNRDATQFGVGYLYPLSRRTSVYTAFAHIDDRNGATYKVGNSTDKGTGDKSFNLGVVTNF